jgi:hypothetical protein
MKITVHTPDIRNEGSDTYISQTLSVYRFQVFKAVTMMNVVFWDVSPCGSCKNKHLGGT